jgi:hypothetical protein
MFSNKPCTKRDIAFLPSPAALTAVHTYVPVSATLAEVITNELSSLFL